jgi:hypothetical protein
VAATETSDLDRPTPDEGTTFKTRESESEIIVTLKLKKHAELHHGSGNETRQSEVKRTHFR